jgi:hypothetical protein
MQSEGANPARETREELHELMQNQEFSSLEEANKFLKDYTNKKNNTPLNEFQGLSPYEMHRLLHFPFDSPDVVRFNFGAIKGPDDAPLLKLLLLITEAVGINGLKPTVKGNLPRAVSREIARSYFSVEKYEYLTRYGEYMSENDIPDLQEARLIAMKAGFIKKSQGKFVVSKECRKLIDSNAWADIYERLFLIYIQELNWAYPQRGIEIPFFQQSFAFTLFLFHVFAKEQRSSDFYAEEYIAAFPMLYEQLPGTEYYSGETIVKNAYDLQAIHAFGRMCGFLTCEYLKYKAMYTVTPLLNRMVWFERG